MTSYTNTNWWPFVEGNYIAEGDKFMQKKTIQGLKALEASGKRRFYKRKQGCDDQIARSMGNGT